MGRGAQCDGTNVLRMGLHRNGATAIALEMRGNRKRTHVWAKKKRDSPKRIALLEAMKSMQLKLKRLCSRCVFRTAAETTAEREQTGT